MAKIIIHQEKCKGCLLCLDFCPQGLIKKGKQVNQKGFVAVEFKDDGSCVGCSFCAVICPDCCIEVYK